MSLGNKSFLPVKRLKKTNHTGVTKKKRKKITFSMPRRMQLKLVEMKNENKSLHFMIMVHQWISDP